MPLGGASEGRPRILKGIFMTWYHIYKTSDGTLKSITDLQPGILPNGLDFVALASRPDKALMWDEATHNLVARPAKVLVNRVTQDLVNSSNPAVVAFRTNIFQPASASNKQVIRDFLIYVYGSRLLRNASDTEAISD